jgi:hypothetical protein
MSEQLRTQLEQSVALARGVVTPLYIEIALHYCCTVGEFPRIEAPACRDAVNALIDRGLLRWNDEARGHEATDGLRLWLECLCAVPFPIQAWHVPSKQSAGGKARAASLTPERRSEIAQAAANARWGK